MGAKSKVVQDLHKIQTEYNEILESVEIVARGVHYSSGYNDKSKNRFREYQGKLSGNLFRGLEERCQMLLKKHKWLNNGMSAISESLEKTTEYENLNKLTSINDSILDLCEMVKDHFVIQERFLFDCYDNVEQYPDKKIPADVVNNHVAIVKQKTEDLTSKYDSIMEQIKEEVTQLKEQKLDGSHRPLSLLRGLGSLCVSVCFLCLIPFSALFNNITYDTTDKGDVGTLFLCWESLKHHVVNSLSSFSECISGEPTLLIVELDRLQEKLVAILPKNDFESEESSNLSI